MTGREFGSDESEGQGWQGGDCEWSQGSDWLGTFCPNCAGSVIWPSPIRKCRMGRKDMWQWLETRASRLWFWQGCLGHNAFSFQTVDLCMGMCVAAEALFSWKTTQPTLPSKRAWNSEPSLSSIPHTNPGRWLFQQAGNFRSTLQEFERFHFTQMRDQTLRKWKWTTLDHATQTAYGSINIPVCWNTKDILWIIWGWQSGRPVFAQP